MADQNGIEKRALYTVTTEVGGQKLAWTHVVPEGTPREKMGCSPSTASIELLPLRENDEAQMWQFRPGECNPEPSYQIVSKMDPFDPPNSPARVYNVNSDFSAVNDNKFHTEFNRMSVGINEPTTECYFKVMKQPNNKFIIQNFTGTTEHLSKSQGSRSAFNEVRYTEAFKQTDGKITIRQMPPSEAPGQFWELTEVGYI